jgi:acyl-CoA synthetase (AMP-forming)/AMP-acid ligase II
LALKSGGRKIRRRNEMRGVSRDLDASSAAFVTAILALLLLRVEFVCIEPPKPPNAKNDDGDRKGREKVFRRFVREVAGCAFGVARESDGTYLEEILRDEEEEEEEEEESFLVFTDKSPALRAPLDEARMMSSSKGCQVGARDAFARKAMEDLNSLWSSSSSSSNNSSDNAYVCFTSGTTGQPKGVKTTRENIDAYAKAKVKNEKLDSSSIVALVSAHVFDPCVGDIASAVVGKSAIATFSPRDELVRGGSRALRDALVASRATHVCCTPSFWEFGGMLDNDDDDDDDDGLLPLPEHLKSVSLGGEKMSKAIKNSFKRESKVTLLNVYGVTEATVYQTSKKISSSSEEEIMRHKGATNIGTPLDESFASLVIVDRNDDDKENEKNDSHEVAEDNIVGEIGIYGLGIPPEGYLVENNARRKAFRDVQFRGRNNIYERRRCYMTGDLGYFDSKTKEYYLLGRIESDRQVKIRGHRIELEGVESLMCERCEETALMPNVIESSSILCFVDEISSSSRGDVDNNNNNNNNENTKEIVAFIKLVGENDEDDDDDDEENRRTRRMDVLLAIDLNCAPWLLLSNNAAMMPSRFVFLEKDEDVSIPLSATGKRDFRAFYERYRNKERFYINLASSSSNSERDEAAKNKDELETLVAKCWADSLSCGINFENIKKNDSFVRMGGNSMSALIACRKIREAMKKRRSTLLENSVEDKDDPNEPGVKKSEAGALLAPENIDNDEDNIDKRLCGAFLGVDGEGPLAPCELLRRPVLASYCAFLRLANFGLNAESASPKLSTSSSSSSTKEEQIHPDVLAAKAAVYRACARGTDVALIRVLVAPFANNAELLREILGNKNAASASTSEMRSENDDENLTALHVLTSRANVNEKYLSEKKVLPLVELLVLELKANVLAQTRSGKTTPIHIAAARGCPNILKILYRALDLFDHHDDVSKKKEKKKELFFVKDVDEQTCLHLASRSGNSEAVRAVLDILFDGDHDDDDDEDDDNKKMSSLSLNILRATDAWNRTARDWAFFLGFSDVIEVFSSTSSRPENDNILLLPVERELISLPSSSEPSSIQMISSNNRKMDVSSEYLDTLLEHLKKEDKTGGGTIENRIRAASGLRDALCANAKNRQTAFDRNVAKVLTETLVSSVSEANKTQDTLETTLLLHVIFCIRNAAGYGPSRKQFLHLDALRALASVVNARRKEKEDNISWQALSAMIVLCRAKETKEGLIASMEMLKELGHGDVCRPIFERTRLKLKDATRDEM